MWKLPKDKAQIQSTKTQELALRFNCNSHVSFLPQPCRCQEQVNAMIGANGIGPEDPDMVGAVAKVSQ